MTVSEMIKVLEKMPLSAKVEAVRVVSEDDFDRANEIERSEEGKVAIFIDPIGEILNTDNKVRIYCTSY